MRIAHITDFYLPRIGGIERQIHHLAVRQAAAGHDVHVLTSTDGPQDSDDVVRLHRLARSSVQHLGPVSPQAWMALPGTLRSLDPDVVHIHASVGSPLALLAGLGRETRHRPTVVTVHSMWAHLARPYRALFAATGLTRRPIVWSAVSRAAATQVQIAVGPNRPVRLLPNGIDPEYWQPLSTRHSADVHVVAVLRLAPRKRPLALLDVLRRARATLPPDVNLRVSVMGDGPLRRAATRYLAQHRMPWVQLIGSGTQDQVRELLHDADIFLASARLESFGIAALEARCAGVPVVALAETGVADFVRHGREGLLCSTDDDLVAAIVRLAGSPDARAAISRHNRRHPPPQSWEHTLATAEQCYEQAAKAVHDGPLSALATTG